MGGLLWRHEGFEEGAHETVETAFVARFLDAKEGVCNLVQVLLKSGVS